MSVDKVQLYVYDVSKGLAAQLSPMFLGKQIQGIWHTGIVVFGAEYFYGGTGIEYCPPGGTILGPPDKIEDIGETQIPKDLFFEYLVDLGPQFLPEKYNILDHNCNSFTNEVAEFLTGQAIPSYISNLPAEVMATPFGAQIRPFLEMMTGPSGGTPVSSTQGSGQHPPSSSS